MEPQAPGIKRIVAACVLAVGFSLPAAADDARMADLLAQLREAENDRAADLILREIRAEWSRSGSPTVDLLLKRGTDALEMGDHGAAVEHLTAAIDHAPEFAEAWHQRATALYLLGQVGPAIADLQQALALNPDLFPALQGFAVILEEMGRKDDALETWRRVAEINPQDDAVAGAIARLELELAGRAL